MKIALKQIIVLYSFYVLYPYVHYTETR